MAASIGSYFENIKSQYLQNKYPISKKFASKCSVFQILLDKSSCSPVILSRYEMYSDFALGNFTSFTGNLRKLQVRSNQ